jgi:hypothetical protein
MKFTVSLTILALAVLLIYPAHARAAGGSDSKLSLFVDCHCSDAVGGDFCSAFKDKVKESSAYRLAEHTDTYGIAVHLWCIDLFSKIPGVNSKLDGTMSAVSVAFTLYAADKLPGEVYEDSSVFRVGKDATDDMAQNLLTAVGQIVAANKTVFEKIRAAEKQPAATPAPTPKVIQ